MSGDLGDRPLGQGFHVVALGGVSLLTPVSWAVDLPLVKGVPPRMLILWRGRSALPAFLGREVVMPGTIRVWWKRRGPRVGDLRGKPAPVRRLSPWHSRGGPSSRLRTPPPPCVHPQPEPPRQPPGEQLFWLTVPCAIGGPLPLCTENPQPALPRQVPPCPTGVRGEGPLVHSQQPLNPVPPFRAHGRGGGVDSLGASQWGRMSPPGGHSRALWAEPVSQVDGLEGKALCGVGGDPLCADPAL